MSFSVSSAVDEVRWRARRDLVLIIIQFLEKFLLKFNFKGICFYFKCV